MKISELKQPYRRMAEYLAETNTDTYYDDKEVLEGSFNWKETDFNFWNYLHKGNYPPITEEIKSCFPTDFDFSEEVKTKPIMQMLDLETQKNIYTQLAKEGKFDELPDTCEFSEPVELEVWDDFNTENKKLKKVLGKFKGLYCVLVVDNTTIDSYQHAQLPTPKIDFSDYKFGDVVEIVTINNEKIYGLLFTQNFGEISLTFSYQSDKVKYVLKEDIKSIKKLK